MEALTETVYSPDSQLRHPLRLFKTMFHDLAASRGLAWRLFVRDISAKYRQSLLGYVWALLPPIVTTVTFVFLRSQAVFKTADTPIPYPAFVMIGMILWQTLVDSIQTPVRLATASKTMLTKINFPREALLLAGFGEILFNFMIRLVLLVAVFAWFKITPPLSVLLLPVGVLAIIALGFMIGIALVPVGLLYTDVSQSIPIFSTFWMFLTPVLYPVPKVKLLAEWNPASPLIMATRDWLTTGSTMHWPGFLLVFAITLVCLFLGWIAYRVAMPHLIARMGG